MPHEAVKKERSGWRDEALSRRHREWGRPIHMTDIDFLVTEHRNGECKALVEYKHCLSDYEFDKSANAAALRHLASTERSPLPLFVVRYWTEPWTFAAYPANDSASALLAKTKIMCERDYVSFLHKLRGLEIPPDLARDLDTSIHWEPAA